MLALRSRRGFFVGARAIAGAAVVVASATTACGTVATTTTRGSASAASVSTSSSAVPGSSQGGGYNEPDGALQTLPSEAPGGSSIQLAFPCDTGTATVDAHPEGPGVTVVETLHGVVHSKWMTYATVTPYIAPIGDPPLTPATARDGEVTVTATNLHEGTSRSVAGANHAWPQVGHIELFGRGGTCDATLYLTAKRLLAYGGVLYVQVERDAGTVVVGTAALPAAGAWNVTATVRSPSGVDHCKLTVTPVKLPYETRPDLHSTLKNVPHLSDFTRLTITVSSAKGVGSRTMTITRTP